MKIFRQWKYLREKSIGSNRLVNEVMATMISPFALSQWKKNTKNAREKKIVEENRAVAVVVTLWRTARERWRKKKKSSFYFLSFSSLLSLASLSDQIFLDNFIRRRKKKKEGKRWQWSLVRLDVCLWPNTQCWLLPAHVSFSFFTVDFANALCSMIHRWTNIIQCLSLSLVRSLRLPLRVVEKYFESVIVRCENDEIDYLEAQDEHSIKFHQENDL